MALYLNVPVGMLGIALVSPSLVALIYGLRNAPSTDGRCLPCAGCVLLAAFLWHAQRKGQAALIDVRIFADRTFFIAALTQFFANGVMFGRQFIVPLYLIVGCGLSAAHAGGLIASTGIGMMCSFPLLGRLTARQPEHAGIVMDGAHQFSPVWTVVSLFLAGAGQETIGIPSISAAYSSIPKARLPVANTALNIARRIGAPVATTLLAVVVAMTTSNPMSVEPGQYRIAFVALSGHRLMAFAVARLLPRRIQRTADA